MSLCEWIWREIYGSTNDILNRDEYDLVFRFKTPTHLNYFNIRYFIIYISVSLLKLIFLISSVFFYLDLFQIGNILDMKMEYL